MTPLVTERIAAGIERVAVPSPTLPPATTTNAWVLGQDRVTVVDPGGHLPDGQHALRAHLADRAIERILLTHHHTDHVSGVLDLAAHTGARIAAHPDTAPLVPFKLDELVCDGDALDIDGVAWTAVHTPGHAHGHICLTRADGYCIAGDLVAGEGTILIAPPEGHLATYLHSLSRVAGLPVHTLLPAHGPAVDAQDTLQHYQKHRLQRLDQLRAHLTQAANTPLALARKVYADHPAAVHAVAAIQIVSQLTYLVERGEAVRSEDGWSRP